MSDNPKDNSNKDIWSEDENRLLESYKNTNKKFTQYFSILLGFALIFLFIILFPYISALENGYTIEKKLNDTTKEIDKNKNISNYIKKSEVGVTNLQSMLDDYPINLEKSFLNLILIPMEVKKNTTQSNISTIFSKSLSLETLEYLTREANTTFSDIPTDQISNTALTNFIDCNNINSTLKNLCIINNGIIDKLDQRIKYINKTYFMKPITFRFSACDDEHYNFTDAWMKCNIENKIQYKIIQMNNTVNNNITSPLNMSGEVIIPKEDIQNLTDAFNDLMDKSKDLSDKATLNFIYSSIDNFRGISNDTIGTALKNLENYTNSLSSQQQIKLQQLSLDREKLIDERNNTLSNKEKIADRLAQIQFPFGKLPITLNESIVVFPIALGIGFIVTSIYLTGSIRLRKQLHSLYKIKYKNSDKELLKKRILLLTPLWIDPLNSKTNIILKFVIFMMPLLIFAISFYAIVFYILSSQNQELYDSLFYYESTYITYIFILLYLICIILFIVGTISPLREIRNYRFD
jgi:hypothetical protein